MNRRKFITTTALALPSVTLLGAISTQQKTYRSVTSIYSNEEMTEWCNKNGIRYVKDDELGKELFPNKNVYVVNFGNKLLFESVDEHRSMRIPMYKKLYERELIPRFIAIIDIFKTAFNSNEKDVIAISYVVGN